MKKINSSLVSIFLLLFCALSVQTVFAVDVPLKKGDPSIGENMLTRKKSVLPVSAEFDGTALGVYFSNPVGVAQITVTDETGFVVYQGAVDTATTLETYIETGDWDAGNYEIQITYETTNLVGSFQL